MKTTFDLPEPLLRRAKAVAAHQGRPLRDLVAEAIEGKLSADESAARSIATRNSAWKAFSSRLQKLPDGSYFNPESIEDESFFKSLEAIRADGSTWHPRDPFAPDIAVAPARVAAPRRKSKPA
ncbi:MAG: hypothetical protein Q8L49_10295 [Burkholderiaceae bacterium]|nr:hypothetical protein [Burkholderiaceae bacterium]